MTGTEQALLIILAAFLALFLLLAIIATYKLIQVVAALKRITEKAERIADNAETLSDIFVKSSSPMAFAKLVSHLANSVFKRQAKKSKKEE